MCSLVLGFQTEEMTQTDNGKERDEHLNSSFGDPCVSGCPGRLNFAHCVANLEDCNLDNSEADDNTLHVFNALSQMSHAH